MNLRRALALGLAGLAAIAALTSCGFSYPTDRISNITSGVNYREGTVDILNAVVVSRDANAGTLIATFVNNSQTDTVTLQSLSGDNTAIGQVDLTKSVSLAPNSLLSLAAKGGIPVNGTFALGQFVALTFEFDNGDTATIKVPVVTDDGQWVGLDISTPSPSAAASSASPSS